MIAIINVTYPVHIFKQVIQAFTSPDLPKRPDSVKELSSIGYFDDGGVHAIYMFDVPDTQLAEFVVVQGKRSAFIGARAPGVNISFNLGQKAEDGIPTVMPMLP